MKFDVLLDLILEGTARLAEASAIAQRMRVEGRDTLTDEEVKGLQDADDASAARQQAAIDATKREGR